MKKILILGVASVQYDVIKFLKENYDDVEVHAIAMKNDGPGSEAADYFAEIDILDIDNIEQYILANDINLVYSVGSDIAMPVIGKVSEDLQMPHFISSNAAIQCNNKNQMRSILGNDFEGNIPFQELEKIHEYNDKLFEGYPLFLKPADSQGQRGVKKINSFDDLEENFELSKGFSRSGTVILEKYVSGPEVSVNGYMVNGVLVFCEISDRVTWDKYEGLIHEHVVPSNHQGPVEEKVSALMEKTAVKMDILNGPVYAQMKIEDNNPYIIEITPRLDGCHMWKLIEKVFGFNLLKLSIEHLLNNDISEVDNYLKTKVKKGTLEFICQEPNTPAYYPDNFFINSDESFKYYSDGEKIRPVNGVFDKIGYKIILEGN